MLWKFKNKKNINASTKIPRHIAVIPDGNRRWAKKRGLPSSAGHKAGSSTLKSIVKYLSKTEVKFLTVYTFSTENWNRSKEEVDYLMNLLTEYLSNAEKELDGTGVKVAVIGDKEKLSMNLIKEIERVEKLTSSNEGLNLIFALNYGGRDEIVKAVKSIANDVQNGSLRPEEINDKIFEKHLYTTAIPDPDLIIRTSGEIRSSNFLLWQSAYSEFVFFDELWPDFSINHMTDAINQYNNRNRRYGGI